MNKLKELEKKIEKLSKELEDLKCELDKEKLNNPQMNTRWRAEENEKYWCIIDECVYRSQEANENCDKARYEIGNYFRTEEEAEKAVEKMKIYTQLKDLALRLNMGKELNWENREQRKYVINCNAENKKICDAWLYVQKDFGHLYCLDENFLDIAKQEIGEEKLIKLFE